jgi:hypothetical protein
MPRSRLPLLAALLLLITAQFALVQPAPAAKHRQPKPARVLLLQGGDALSDTAAAQALADEGFEVVRGPATLDFTNAGNPLLDIDVVVMLLGTNNPAALHPGGSAAIERFVRQGGALVTGEWSLLRSGLDPIMPATSCGWNVADSTTYTLVTPNASVNAGLPDEFSFELANVGGSESCLEPREDATVLYTSSNGGGRGGAGLVAWNVDQGRVASFSAMIGATELENDNFKGLFQNTVGWMVRIRDTTPPRVRSFTVSGQNDFVAERAVTVSYEVSDRGGSGLGSFLLRELRFSGDPSNGWVEVASSGWQPVQAPSASFGWTLDPTPGIHYLQLFVADRAGNISRRPGRVSVNYRPTEVPIALDGLHIYRIEPGRGTNTFVRMDALSGNPDLYVFGPGVAFAPESDGPIEQTNFEARAGMYQIEVAGHVAGSYSLSVTLAAGGGGNTAPGDGVQRRPRISVTAINPPEPEESAADLPDAPVDESPANLGQRVYLPMLRN